MSQTNHVVTAASIFLFLFLLFCSCCRKNAFVLRHGCICRYFSLLFIFASLFFSCFFDRCFIYFHFRIFYEKKIFKNFLLLDASVKWHNFKLVSTSLSIVVRSLPFVHCSYNENEEGEKEKREKRRERKRGKERGRRRERERKKERE